MTQEQWRRLEDRFAEALDLDLGPAERATFVRQCCPGDPGLRDEFEQLLEFDDQAERGRFLDPMRTSSDRGSRIAPAVR